MALFLLGAHAQTLRHMLATGSFQDGKLKYVLRLLIEGIGARSTPRKHQPGNAQKAHPKSTRNGGRNDSLTAEQCREVKQRTGRSRDRSSERNRFRARS